MKDQIYAGQTVRFYEQGHGQSNDPSTRSAFTKSDTGGNSVTALVDRVNGDKLDLTILSPQGIRQLPGVSADKWIPTEFTLQQQQMGQRQSA